MTLVNVRSPRLSGAIEIIGTVARLAGPIAAVFPIGGRARFLAGSVAAAAATTAAAATAATALPALTRVIAIVARPLGSVSRLGQHFIGPAIVNGRFLSALFRGPFPNRTGFGGPPLRRRLTGRLRGFARCRSPPFDAKVGGETVPVVGGRGAEPGTGRLGRRSRSRRRGSPRGL